MRVLMYLILIHIHISFTCFFINTNNFCFQDLSCLRAEMKNTTLQKSPQIDLFHGTIPNSDAVSNPIWSVAVKNPDTVADDTKDSRLISAVWWCPVYVVT